MQAVQNRSPQFRAVLYLIFWHFHMHLQYESIYFSIFLYLYMFAQWQYSISIIIRCSFVLHFPFMHTSVFFFPFVTRFRIHKSFCAFDYMQMTLSAATKLRVEMLKNCMKCDNCSLDLNTCEQLMCNTLESNNILC